MNSHSRVERIPPSLQKPRFFILICNPFYSFLPPI
ncbi:hypothetical protein Ccrd_024053 [Cynara cardunculus var. scolymus]|uniref:Uncharacterized protein n=1 Tax=Cynara cardunculus var. scolymus TaxID=59895 RepID=A0A103XCS5_CYNCS|nr:hypothetical protein Ccrd_024053 [Cynara cardunculus var. scolymus]